MKPGIIMTRVSADEQNKGNSPDEQLIVCTEYAQHNGIHVADGMAFHEDYSGYSLERPELDKIRAILAKNKGMALIVKSGDRLARSVFVALMLANEFARHDVELHFVSRGKVDYRTPEGLFIFQMECAGNEYWGSKAKQNMRDGQIRQVKSGVPLGQGPAPYGYQKEGKKRETRFIVVEEHARVVILIFEWYVNEELGTSDIARRLNAMEIPIPAVARKNFHHANKMGIWTPTMVIHILRNEVYTGVWHYQKTRWNPVTRKSERVEDKEEWLSANVPAIIDRSLWEKAEAISAKNSKFEAGRQPKYQYLMARRMTCSCGRSIIGRYSPVNGKEYFHYACKSRVVGDEFTKPCGLPYFRVEDVDAIVKKWIQELEDSPEEMLRRIKEMQAQARHNNAPIELEIQATERQIEELKKQLEEAVRDQYSAKKPYTKAAYAKLIEQTENAIEEGEQRLETLKKRLIPTEIPPALLDILVQSLKRKAKMPDEASHVLNSYLGEPFEMPEGAYMIRPGGERVELTGTYYRTREDFDSRIATIADGAKERQEPPTFEDWRSKVDKLDLTATLAVEGDERVVLLHWQDHTDRLVVPIRESTRSRRS